MKIYEQIEKMNEKLKELLKEAEKNLGTSNKRVFITREGDIIISNPKISTVSLSINEAKDVYLFLKEIFEKEI